MKSKTVEFGDYTRLLKYIQDVLRKRARNGYQIYEKSYNFPTVPAFELFTSISCTNSGQIRLF